MRRLRAARTNISIYTADVGSTSRFYAVNSGKYFALENDKVAEKDFAFRLETAGLRQVTGRSLAANTYQISSVASDRTAVLDLHSGKLTLRISDPQSHKSVDVFVCPP